MLNEESKELRFAHYCIQSKSIFFQEEFHQFFKSPTLMRTIWFLDSVSCTCCQFLLCCLLSIRHCNPYQSSNNALRHWHVYSKVIQLRDHYITFILILLLFGEVREIKLRNS